LKCFLFDIFEIIFSERIGGHPHKRLLRYAAASARLSVGVSVFGIFLWITW
jgi:hypothetical protein